MRDLELVLELALLAEIKAELRISLEVSSVDRVDVGLRIGFKVNTVVWGVAGL